MSQQINVQNGADVVSFLKAQHQQIKNTFGKVLNAKGEAKAALFVDLKLLMSAHEAGEEAIVHPVAAKKLPRGEMIVRERLHEENKAKRAILALDHLDVDTTDFDDKLRALQADVLAHAEAEEREEFDKLALELDAIQLQRMRLDLESVEITNVRRESQKTS